MQSQSDRLSATVPAFLRRRSSKLSLALTLIAAILLAPVQATAAAPAGQASISSAGLTKKQKKQIIALIKKLAGSGPQGPQGPQGAQGAQGLQGQQGIEGPSTGPAGGALAGTYPNPTLNVSGGPCANGQALTNLSSLSALTCSVGVYSDGSSNVVAAPDLFAPTTGTDNSGLGASALKNTTTGTSNSAVGSSALNANTGGSSNSALGAGTLFANINGSSNSAVGRGALASNTLGNANAAVGRDSLGANTQGSRNAALGDVALGANTFGNDNSAVGRAALLSNDTGSNNTAVGKNALFFNTSGGVNTALGLDAGFSLTTGDNNIDIANTGVAAESNTIRIGVQGTQNRAFLAGVSGVTTGAMPAVPVLVDSNGQLGVTSSSRRFKEDIQPLDRVGARLMALDPVSFRYKGRSGPRQYGLIAEQVAKVFPNLVARGGQGKPTAIAYQQFPALLLAQAQRQQAQIRALRSLAGRQQAQIRWLVRHARH